MKTYTDQVQEHLIFLRDNGLDVETLEFGESVRCHSIGHTEGRGNVAYRSILNEMNKGYIGIVTDCRDPSGAKHRLKTYGLGNSDNHGERFDLSSVKHIQVDHSKEYKEAARRAYGFWQKSNTFGTSDYLIRKQVGAYGVRFREDAIYGKVAVVPMRDEKGWLWSYQILNPDGTKRMPEKSRTKGLFHALHPLIDGRRIGIAEGYIMDPKN